MPQLTVEDNLVTGQEGGLADSMYSDKVSRPVEALGGSIPFGRAAVLGTDTETVTLPSGTGKVFLGVSVLSHRVANPNQAPDAQLNATGEPAYLELDSATILRKGRIYVKVEQAVVPGDPVFFRHTATPPEELGAFRIDADTADADQITSGAAWVTAAGAGEIAVLELNLPA